MEYNYQKSVTIPHQVLSLKEIVHRFTNGVPISDNLERQGTYDFATSFDPNNMPTDDDFNLGHDCNEIDITIAEMKSRRHKDFIDHNESLLKKKKKKESVESNNNE